MIYCSIQCSVKKTCNKEKCIYDTAIVTCAHTGCNTQIRYPAHNDIVPLYCDKHIKIHRSLNQPVYRNGIFKSSSKQADLNV